MSENGVIPLIRYRNVTEAVHWLTRCLGFKTYNIVKDSDGTIAYAELSYGHGVIMVGPVGHSTLDKILRQPHEINGVNTQCCYVVPEDIMSHYRKTCEEGAEIVLELSEHNNGEHTYVARDIEGHLWNFGTYKPWKRSTNPIHKKQTLISNSIPKKKFTGAIAIFVVFSLLLYTSFTLINSYFTLTKSETSKELSVYLPHTNIEQKFTKADTISRNSENDGILSLERVEISPYNEKEKKGKISNHSGFSLNTIEQQSGSWNKEGQIAKMGKKNTELDSDTLKQLDVLKRDQKDNILSRNSPINPIDNKTYQSSSSIVEEIEDTTSVNFPATTGSIGDQPNIDPALAPDEILPPVTVPRTIPTESKAPKVRNAVEIKKYKSKSQSPKMTPAGNKKKILPSTEKTLFYLFN